MVEILSLILLHNEQPALAAVTLALEAGTPSKQTILKAIRSIVSAEEVDQVCSNLFSQYVLESAIRSGDAHLKNFGVLCTRSLRPQLSTAYDMLTMGAYALRAINGDALDGMARKSRGTRRWPRRADLNASATLCSVSSEEKHGWYSRLQEAIRSVSMKVLEFCRSGDYEPATSRLARMLDFVVTRLRKRLSNGDCSRARRGLGAANAEVELSLAGADPDTTFTTRLARIQRERKSLLGSAQSHPVSRSELDSLSAISPIWSARSRLS